MHHDSLFRVVLFCGFIHALGCSSAQTTSRPQETSTSRTAFRIPADAPLPPQSLSRSSADVTQDLGEILAGRLARHTFSFPNPANSTLRLLGDSAIRKSCGCTQVEVSEHQLQPDQATSVQLSLDTTNRRGPFAEHATLHWSDDDGTVFPITFGLSGVVRPLLAADPQELYFTRDDVLGGRAQTVRILGNSLMDLERMEWHTIGDFVDAARAPTSSPAEPAFSIRCRPGATDSPRRGALIVRVPFHPTHDDVSNDSFSLSEHSITIFAEDPTPLHVSPARLVFARTDEDAPWQATAVLSGMEITPSAQIVRCEMDATPLEHTEKRISPTLLHLSLRIPAALSHLSETASITITLSTGVSRVVTATFLNSQP